MSQRFRLAAAADMALMMLEGLLDWVEEVGQLRDERSVRECPACNRITGGSYLFCESCWSLLDGDEHRCGSAELRTVMHKDATAGVLRLIGTYFQLPHCTGHH